MKTFYVTTAFLFFTSLQGVFADVGFGDSPQFSMGSGVALSKPDNSANFKLTSVNPNPFQGRVSADIGTVNWDGRNQSGTTVAPSIYILRFTTHQNQSFEKRILKINFPQYLLVRRDRQNSWLIICQK